MDIFTKLFGSLVAFVYHCFDRIVILGHLPLLTRPENIVHFFREVHQVGAITKEILRRRTDEYVGWVESFARNHDIPIEWAPTGVRKENHVAKHLRRMDRAGRFGVYFILKSMEVGPSFRITAPKYPCKDPDYRIVAPQKCRYTHIYFYIVDPVLGPMSMCVGTFLPFRISYWLNGHSYIERELLRENVAFRKDDNAFLATDDPRALQAAADRLSSATIRQRLDYWTFLLGPKFSKKERAAINLTRHYSIQQVEYCRNLIFRRNFPIHKLYERSCDVGLMRLVPDKITQVFGFRINKRLRGKLQTVVERIDHGHHVLRACAKNAVIRMYEKFSTFLRLEALSNNLRDFGLRKSLDHLDSVRKVLGSVTDRFAAFEAEAMNVHVDFSLFQRIAKPILCGKTKVPGIKLHDTRMIRLMEVLLDGATTVHALRAADLHKAILSAFSLRASAYTITQLRYDLRKMKAHGLIERDGKRYAYRLTDKGNKVALLFVLFHKRVCGPLAGSLLDRAVESSSPSPLKLTPFEAAYHRADRAIQRVVDLLAA